MKNASRQTKCPFTETDISKAYDSEVSLFLHCHLRGYDRHGDGKCPDQGNWKCATSRSNFKRMREYAEMAGKCLPKQ